MTKMERKKIHEAMRMFGSDGNDWEAGMNILRGLLGLPELFAGMKNAKTISIFEIAAEMKTNSNAK